MVIGCIIFINQFIKKFSDFSIGDQTAVACECFVLQWYTRYPSLQGYLVYRLQYTRYQEAVKQTKRNCKLFTICL